MDMPKTISEKLDFTVIVYHQVMKQLSLVDIILLRPNGEKKGRSI